METIKRRYDMKEFKRPTMLMILDGFGIAPDGPGNAVSQAVKPNIDSIFKSYPGTTLAACGLAVGLPEGQMGNSEVGHLNIGAGRIVYQELTRITKEIEEGAFFENAALNQAMDHCLKNGSALHVHGLVSDGGVHSHLTHLFAIIDMAKKKGLKEVYVHCFLDGRDVPPRCAKIYLDQLEEHMAEVGLGKIGVISGRYYAMDRDKRWERVQKAYDAMTLADCEIAGSADAAVDASYAADTDDEFLVPVSLGKERVVSDHDAMIMFNFRPDRAREITRAFVDDAFDGFERTKRPEDICYVCMTQYDAEMPNVIVAYPPEHHDNTLGEYISGLGMKQLRIAETEKYAHVTFFFNGGVEAPNENEDRILVPSPKVATYDLQPEMSAYEVTDKVLEAIDSEKYDMIILNFANADMVGHTGVMQAAIDAVQALDVCVEKIRQKVLEKDGQIFLTADHGNADEMLDAEGNVVTSHSLNPVPFYHISNSPFELEDGGKLADIAPTMLDAMDIEVPAEMTGRSLLKK